MEKNNYIKTLNLNTVYIYDLNHCLKQIIAKSLKDIFDNYNDFGIYLKKHHHKQFFYHYFIKDICEIYSKEKSYFSFVFYYNDTNNDFNDEVIKLINKLNRYLPVTFYIDKLPFEFIEENSTAGEIIELKEKIKIAIEKKNKKSYSFQNIKNFAKRYKLDFLSEQFFNDLKVKHGIYK